MHKHTWCNFQDDVTTQKKDCNINYDDFLSVLEEYDHNFFRGWHWEDAHYSPLPFARTGPGNALDGKPKFDLTKYNQAYYDHMRKRITKAANRGIYCSVMLFQGWSIENKGGGRTPNPWTYHPFNKANNINSVNGDPNSDGLGREIHTLASDGFGIDLKVTAIQETYVKHTIDQLNDLDNIIWEISNETHPASYKWQYHMIDLIHRYEKTKPKQHIVWMNLYAKKPTNQLLFNSPADIISPDKSGPNFRDPPPSKGDKVVILDTDHLWGVGTDGGFVWRSITRGYYPIFMDPLHNIGWYKKRWNPQDKKWVDMRKAMGCAAMYAQRMDLARARPSAEISSTRYCLVNPGNQYLIFKPRGKEFWVKLEAGSYEYEWFNPQTFSVVDTGKTNTTGGQDTFTAPFDGPAVLYISRTKDKTNQNK